MSFKKSKWNMGFEKQLNETMGLNKSEMMGFKSSGRWVSIAESKMMGF